MLRTVELWEAGDRTPAVKQGIDAYLGLLRRQGRSREADELETRLGK